MRIEGRKHGFHIGSGRTVKNCRRAGKFDLYKLPDDWRCDMYKIKEKIFEDQNPDLFELKWGW